jgi:hypothetical protein
MSKYLGFLNLHDLLDARRAADQAVNGSRRGTAIIYHQCLCVNNYAGAGSAAGAAHADLHVQALDPTNPDIIMYWMMRLGRVGTVDGVPGAADRDHLVNVSRAATAALADFARRAGFRPVAGTFAYPDNLQLVQGDPIRSGVDFNPKTCQFVIGDRQGEAPPQPGDATATPAPPVDTEAIRREDAAFALYIDRGGTMTRADWWNRLMCAIGAYANATDEPWQPDARHRLRSYRAELLLRPGEPLPNPASPYPPATDDRVGSSRIAPETPAEPPTS